MSLQVNQLCKDYPTRSGPLRVLRDVNLELRPGEALAVMGPSGSGKSTLLHILGHTRPAHVWHRLPGRQRSIRFLGTGTRRFPQPQHRLRFSGPSLATTMFRAGKRAHTDTDCLERPQRSRSLARELLSRVGLSDRLEHRPAELSGGERQRVAVARALIQHPILLLADEPTGNLDRHTAQDIGNLLLELHRRERTILIVVTHSAELAGTFPRQMEMLDGTLQSRERLE